jgi:hypothetical protein
LGKGEGVVRFGENKSFSLKERRTIGSEKP